MLVKGAIGDLLDDESTLIEIMLWRWQEPSHYLTNVDQDPSCETALLDFTELIMLIGLQ